MAISDGFISVANLQGDLTSLLLRNGYSLQTIGFNETITSDLISFAYSGDKRLMIPKSSNSNAAIVLGTISGKLYCFDMETLEQIWLNTSANSAILGTPVFTDNKIIFYTNDGKIICVDGRNGVLIWKYDPVNEKVQIPKKLSPIYNNKHIFFTDVKGNVFAIDLNLGIKEWGKNFNAGPSLGISEDGQKIFIKSRENKFRIINATNGKNIKTISINYGVDHSISNPIQNRDIIYVPTENGNVYRINKNNKYKTILNFGDSPILSLQWINENNLLVSNIDGRIILFSYNEPQ
jgi:outer membrane protein assembly factor BamB